MLLIGLKLNVEGNIVVEALQLSNKELEEETREAYTSCVKCKLSLHFSAKRTKSTNYNENAKLQE